MSGRAGQAAPGASVSGVGEVGHYSPFLTSGIPSIYASVLSCGLFQCLELTLGLVQLLLKLVKRFPLVSVATGLPSLPFTA